MQGTAYGFRRTHQPVEKLPWCPLSPQNWAPNTLVLELSTPDLWSLSAQCRLFQQAGVFCEVCCYSITSRMPSLIRFSSCAPTTPTIISGEVGSADDRVLPTQSSANLFDLSAPARCSKMLTEVSVPCPLSSAS